MIGSSQIIPGMVLLIDGEAARVESSVKVATPKGGEFMRVKLKKLIKEKSFEKNFPLEQEVEELKPVERNLEYLYVEGNDYVFLDTDELVTVSISSKVVGDKIAYLKEGVGIKGTLYGGIVFAVELPQFMELMVIKIEVSKSDAVMSNSIRMAVLETGAKIEVPPFVEIGDIIKVNTRGEYVQRI